MLLIHADAIVVIFVHFTLTLANERVLIVLRFVVFTLRVSSLAIDGIFLDLLPLSGVPLGLLKLVLEVDLAFFALLALIIFTGPFDECSLIVGCRQVVDSGLIGRERVIVERACLFLLENRYLQREGVVDYVTLVRAAVIVRLLNDLRQLT